MLIFTTPTRLISTPKPTVKFITKPNSSTYSTDPWPGLVPATTNTRGRRVVLTHSNSNGSVKPSTSASKLSTPEDEVILVGEENRPLEGVIQFDKPTSNASIAKWGRVALLAGGDVLALLLFSAIGRFSHGFPVFSFDTLHTADPFIAGIIPLL